MSDYNQKLAELQQRLEKVIQYQGFFDKEINSIKSEISLLQAEKNKQTFEQPTQPQKVNVYVPPTRSVQNEPQFQPPKSQQTQNQTQSQSPPPQSTSQPIFSTNYSTAPTISENNNWEKFIGENLISKIGIVILIIGVAIGAKYAIDNNWITPLMRIVFGYFIGLGLIAFAIKLKPNYLNFSSVLLSGGMATMYFITFFAYSYYHLISQLSAFSTMLIFTIFTVLGSIVYNRQVIAQIGLVGAYAIPFLLSENTGKVEILFTYIAIINIGILAVSAKKYWKSLFYSSFLFTWITFAVWFGARYLASQDFVLAFTFLSIFFAIFYATFLVYKLLNHEILEVENVFIILLNSFIFYGYGYALLDGKEGWENTLGFFTILNALIHFGVGFLIRQLKLGDKTVFYLTAILVLTFVSIAFPIQTNGKWTALFWTGEAVALFWIGRTKRISLFENYSYPVMLLACFSLLIEWMSIPSRYGTLENAVYPILNKYFVTGIFFVLGFGLINFLNRNEKYKSSLQTDLAEVAKYLLAGVFIFALYNVFRIEIANYFHLEEIRTAIPTKTDYEYEYNLTNPAINSFNIIWQLNYTILFLTILAWINIKKIRSEVLGVANLVLNAMVTAFFLLVGLYILSDLREMYLLQSNDNFQFGIIHIFIRYISIPFVLILFWTSHNLIKQEFMTCHIPLKLLSFLFDCGFYFSMWILVTSELLNWMDYFNVKDSYKLGLSILWGIYALFLIVLGIYQRKTHLRIGAIALFSLTLIKLFLYDLSDLGTISKTVVFVSLGILLLIVSFLYNKYKHLIFDEEEAVST
ncbi:MAG: DUF2339 domain-containing protein [Pyrinomonadaceae bacterium]|nr:DUF2339 domain-containing protein [Pyrinomonadaceae bacterium]